MKPVYRVFISHAGVDEWIARQMASMIGRIRGPVKMSAFIFERDIAAGDLISEEVMRAISESEEVVVLFSEASKSSVWVWAEVGAALALKKRISSVLDKMEPKDLPSIVSNAKAVYLNKFEGYLKELQDRARKKAQ